MRVNACLGWDGGQGQATPSHPYDGFPLMIAYVLTNKFVGDKNVMEETERT